MTPIQQHEQELRAMMERAGLTPKERDGRYMDGYGDPVSVCLNALSTGFVAFVVDGPKTLAEHPDPRIALRHCLEMAGLMEDRPPVTDGGLVKWLTERWGEGVRMGGVTAWARARIRFFHSDRSWVRGSGEAFEARELGAILWCAEKWPVAK